MRGIIIGGSKGLGRELLYKLNGFISLSRSSSRYKLDLEDPEEKIIETVTKAINDLNGLECLIISSGMGAYLGYSDMLNSDKIEKLFRVNTLGPIYAYTAARRALAKSGGKCIFVTSSVADHGARALSVYAATKGAINSFVRSEGRTAAKLGYAVCAVAPGWFESDMTKDINPKLKEAIVKYIPEKRLAKASEVADFIADLIDQSNWIVQGQVFTVTGGY